MTQLVDSKKENSKNKDVKRLKRDGSNLKDFPQREPTPIEIQLMLVVNELNDEERKKRKEVK